MTDIPQPPADLMPNQRYLLPGFHASSVVTLVHVKSDFAVVLHPLPPLMTASAQHGAHLNLVHGRRGWHAALVTRCHRVVDGRPCWLCMRMPMRSAWERRSVPKPAGGRAARWLLLAVLAGACCACCCAVGVGRRHQHQVMDIMTCAGQGRRAWHPRRLPGTDGCSVCCQLPRLPHKHTKRATDSSDSSAAPLKVLVPLCTSRSDDPSCTVSCTARRAPKVLGVQASFPCPCPLLSFLGPLTAPLHLGRA